MNKEKLLAIATLVRSIPQEQFDMGVWKSSRHSCETVGCAIGHSIQQGILSDLELSPREFKDQGVIRVTGPLQPRRIGAPQDPRCGFVCVEEVLDLLPKEMDYLFTEEEYEGELEDEETGFMYITPEQVASRIEAFVTSEGEITS